MGRQQASLVRRAILVSALAFAAVSHADVSSDRSGSILVFPKVIANGFRDTIIEITNTSNSLVRAHCFYVNAQLPNPEEPESPTNRRVWQETDFDIALTRQQPTYWVASEGRNVNPLDPTCGPFEPFCPNAGFDPGLVPPLVPDFEGELKCVEVDDSGSPIAGNHLIGSATLVNEGLNLLVIEKLLQAPFAVFLPGESSKYNALAVLGTENNGDGTLVLGGGQCVGSGPEQGAVCASDDDCGASAPCAAEYNACPAVWILNHVADGAPDLILEEGTVDANANPIYTTTRVATQLTVVPCTENFETQVPTEVTLQFIGTNEFELSFSMSTTVRCWENFAISDVGGSEPLTLNGNQVLDPQGSLFFQTRIRSAEQTPFGVFMVAEELHAAKASTITVDPPGSTPPSTFSIPLGTTAAANLHTEGERTNPDIITIPAEQVAP